MDTWCEVRRTNQIKNGFDKMTEELNTRKAMQKDKKDFLRFKITYAVNYEDKEQSIKN
jgi:hypothetical protein